MKLTLYTFAKRANSTKIVDVSGKTCDNVYIKRDTSLINPVFVVSGVDLTVTYAKLEDLSRYYFVKDITYRNNNIYEISCEEDTLATYKEPILSKSCNIAYAADTVTNITDMRIPVTGGIKISEALASYPTGMTLVGSPTSAVINVTGSGSFGTYIINLSDVANLMNGIDTWWEGLNLTTVDNIPTALSQLFFSGGAPECLKSCFYLPIFPTSDAMGDETTIYLGTYPTKVSGYKVTTSVIYKTTTVDIPWANSGWLRNSPYSQLSLYVPLFGLFALPTSDLINDDSLSLRLSICYTSGDMGLNVSGATSGNIVVSASTNVAVPAVFGSNSANFTRATSAAVTTALGAAGAIATGGIGAIPAGLFTAAAASTLDFGNSGAAGAVGGGGGGAMVGLDPVIHCFCASKSLSDTQANLVPKMGYPVFAKGTLSSHTGFIQTDDFDFDGLCTSTERDTINHLVNSGIFIE